ncbi:protein-methionine-sulfoxide reductase catalytic subunit MsrP [Geobacter sp. 60473]|uniref:protein-methionine-sulfoxide reductase catalytic subunit MsrP n=1 Tax=Geobacter sp. 60473 TaxID=3080755 RepID=UPI002B2B3911|nr:protein-methionine-sulfoxide reductase catalytic subunit MsrP [Geobacter sp. 60473]
MKNSRFTLPSREISPEEVFFNRRTFLKALGFAGLNAWPLLNACTNYAMERRELGGTLVNLKTLPARPNTRYPLDRPLTDRQEAATYCNFYEFTSGKDVWRYVDQFITRPWQISVTGMVRNPKIFDVDELVRAMPLEERTYRHRCVEAWAMAVPWTGFPLAELVKRADPLPNATHLRFLSFLRRDQAPNQSGLFSTDLWPYHEGLTLAEATNELAFLALGVYGRELPKQHGAPIRLVLPWKYGFKSIKSIVEINFTDRQPSTFWSSLGPDEYGFWANVNPDVDHPRWSQKSERMLGTGERRPTVIFNGYGEHVARLYRPPRREFFY